MLKEKSCGAVIFRINNGLIEFLLVYSGRNSHWGFAKGHVEDGETEIETAKREILEETGISRLEFIDGFYKEDIYRSVGARKDTVGKAVEKHSVYFLAKALSPLENKQFKACDEIYEIKWFKLGEALKMLPFENQKEILRSASEYIKC